VKGAARLPACITCVALAACGRSSPSGTAASASAAPERPFTSLAADAAPTPREELLGEWICPSRASLDLDRDYSGRIAKASPQDRPELTAARTIGVSHLSLRLTITQSTLGAAQEGKPLWLAGYAVERESGRTLEVRLSGAQAPAPSARFTLGEGDTLSAPDLAPAGPCARAGQR
jgi:hypothetical protein